MTIGLLQKMLGVELQNSTKKYVCHYCNRNYARRIFYERHISGCALLHERKQNPKECIQSDYHNHALPSILDLHRMVEELAFQYKHIREENQELREELESIKSTIIEKKITPLNSSSFNPNDLVVEHVRKRHHVSQLLNTSHTMRKPNIIFDSWLKTLVVSQKDLTIVFENTLVEGLTSFLNTQMNPITNVPLCSIQRNQNIQFYIYTLENEENVWKHVDHDSIDKAIFHIYQLFLGQFHQWNKTNTGKVSDNNERFHKFYEQQFIKFVGTSIHFRSKMCAEMRKSLHQLVKYSTD